MYFRIRIMFVALLGAGSPFMTAAQEAVPDILRSSRCLACHEVGTKRIGPPFAAIAKRYSGVPDAQSYLVHSIQNGGRARWGPIPMPAQPQVSVEQAQAIATWILSLTDKADP